MCWPRNDYIVIEDGNDGNDDGDVDDDIVATASRCHILLAKSG